MTSSQVLASVGLLLSLGGSVLAVKAFSDEWRTHRPGVPMVPVRGSLRRLFRRSRPQTIHGSVNAVLAHATVSAAAAVIHANETTEQRLARLVEEVEALRASTTERVNDLARAHQTTVERLGSLGHDLAALDEKVRDVATGSVRLELVGLFLVAVGAVLAAVPSVLGW